LSIFESSLGPEHPHVAIAALAQALRDDGRYEEAEPLFQRALALREKIFGPDHQLTAMVRREYAKLLRATGRDDEAEQLRAESH
jgi:tetratricopeptide (TPR) repeat protein